LIVLFIITCWSAVLLVVAGAVPPLARLGDRHDPPGPAGAGRLRSFTECSPRRARPLWSNVGATRHEARPVSGVEGPRLAEHTHERSHGVHPDRGQLPRLRRHRARVAGGRGGRFSAAACVYPRATQTLGSQLSARHLRLALLRRRLRRTRRAGPAPVGHPAPGPARPDSGNGARPGSPTRCFRKPVPLLPLGDRLARLRRRGRCRHRPADERPSRPRRARQASPTSSRTLWPRRQSRAPAARGRPAGPAAARRVP